MAACLEPTATFHAQLDSMRNLWDALAQDRAAEV